MSQGDLGDQNQGTVFPGYHQHPSATDFCSTTGETRRAIGEVRDRQRGKRDPRCNCAKVEHAVHDLDLGRLER